MPNPPTDPVQLCALADLKVDMQQSGESADDPVLLRCIVDASDAFTQNAGRAFGYVSASAQVLGRPYVVWGRRALRIQLPTPHIQAVSALAVRCDPQAAWTAVDLARVEWDTAPPLADSSSLVRAWLPGPDDGSPVWARVSYVAGWLCDFPQTPDDPPASDPPPPDLQAIARWWAQWYWRKKDAPMERTANAITGTVTIPREMPDDLRRGLARWKPLLGG